MAFANATAAPLAQEIAAGAELLYPNGTANHVHVPVPVYRDPYGPNELAFAPSIASPLAQEIAAAVELLHSDVGQVNRVHVPLSVRRDSTRAPTKLAFATSPAAPLGQVLKLVGQCLGVCDAVGVF